MPSLVLTEGELATRIKGFQECDIVRHTTRWYLNSTGVMVQVGSYTCPEDMFMIGWQVTHEPLQPEWRTILNFAVTDIPSTLIWSQTDTDGGAYVEGTCLTATGKPGIKLDKPPDPSCGYYLERGKVLYIMAGQSTNTENSLYNFGLCKLWFLRTYR